MSSLWGIPDNWAPSIDGSDQRNAAQQEMQIQALGAGVEHTKAMTAESGMRQKQAAMQLQMIQRRMQMATQRAGQQSGQAVDIEAQMLQAAQDEEAMGNPDKAARIYNEIAGVREKGKQAALAEGRLKELTAEHDIKRKQGMYEIFAGINGPQDYDAAMKLIQSKYPDVKLPPELQQYDPRMVELMKRVTKNGLEQSKATWQQTKEADIDKRHEENLAATRRNLEYREARTDARHADTERRITNNKKVGGDKITAPHNPDNKMVMAADALIHRDYPELAKDVPVGRDFASEAAYEVASQAQALMSANRGLSGSEAMQRIYKKMKDAKMFSTEIEPATKIGPVKLGSDKRVDRFTPNSKTVSNEQDKPLPLPPKGTALEDGKIYQKGDTVFKWDDKKKKGIVIPNLSGASNAGE